MERRQLNQEINQEVAHLISDNFFSYNKTFKEVHDVSAIAGISIEGWDSYYSSITGTGYDSDLVQTISSAAIIADATSITWVKR